MDEFHIPTPECFRGKNVEDIRFTLELTNPSWEIDFVRFTNAHNTLIIKLKHRGVGQIRGMVSQIKKELVQL